MHEALKDQVVAWWRGEAGNHWMSDALIIGVATHRTNINVFHGFYLRNCFFVSVACNGFFH